MLANDFYKHSAPNGAWRICERTFSRKSFGIPHPHFSPSLMRMEAVPPFRKGD